MRCAEGGQLPVQVGQAVNDELDPAIGARQRIEDFAVEDEHTPHMTRRAQRVVQRCVIVAAQVAAKPDECGIDRSRHRVSVPQS